MKPLLVIIFLASLTSLTGSVALADTSTAADSRNDGVSCADTHLRKHSFAPNKSTFDNVLRLRLSKPLGLHLNSPITLNGELSTGAMVYSLSHSHGSAQRLDQRNQQEVVGSTILRINNETMIDLDISQVMKHIEAADSPVDIEFGINEKHSPTSNNVRQVQWVQSYGGYFSRKQMFRHQDPNDSSSLFGVFATDDIEEGELLAAIPWECIIARDDDDDDDTFCDTVQYITNELKKGSSSAYAPYLESLAETLERHAGLLPSAWSRAGQDLFLKTVGKEGLPPTAPFYLKQEWDACPCQQDCSLQQKVACLIHTHGEDGMMVPLSEKYNHHKRLAGAMLHFPESGPFGLKVRATRSIQKGEQVYLDYRAKDTAYGSPDYGTPELLRDFGFVESYPQRWTFHGFGFDIDMDDSNGDLQISWLDEYHGDSRVSKEALAFLVRQLHRLEQLDSEIDKSRAPMAEIDIITQFRDSMMTAIRHVIEDVSDG